MGYWKQEQLRWDGLLVEARRIALEADVLRRCEYHGMVWEDGADPAEAYKLGNWLYSRGKLEEFRSRREMTDAIQAAIEDAGVGGCTYPDCPYG